MMNGFLLCECGRVFYTTALWGQIKLCYAITQPVDRAGRWELTKHCGQVSDSVCAELDQIQTPHKRGGWGEVVVEMQAAAQTLVYTFRMWQCGSKDEGT